MLTNNFSVKAGEAGETAEGVDVAVADILDLVKEATKSSSTSESEDVVVPSVAGIKETGPVNPAVATDEVIPQPEETGAPDSEVDSPPKINHDWDRLAIIYVQGNHEPLFEALQAAEDSDFEEIVDKHEESGTLRICQKGLEHLAEIENRKDMVSALRAEGLPVNRGKVPKNRIAGMCEDKMNNNNL